MFIARQSQDCRRTHLRQPQDIETTTKLSNQKGGCPRQQVDATMLNIS